MWSNWQLLTAFVMVACSMCCLLLCAAKARCLQLQGSQQRLVCQLKGSPRCHECGAVWRDRRLLTLHRSRQCQAAQLTSRRVSPWSGQTPAQPCHWGSTGW